MTSPGRGIEKEETGDILVLPLFDIYLLYPECGRFITEEGSHPLHAQLSFLNQAFRCVGIDETTKRLKDN